MFSSPSPWSLPREPNCPVQRRTFARALDGAIDAGLGWGGLLCRHQFGASDGIPRRSGIATGGKARERNAASLYTSSGFLRVGDAFGAAGDEATMLADRVAADHHDRARAAGHHPNGAAIDQSFDQPRHAGFGVEPEVRPDFGITGREAALGLKPADEVVALNLLRGEPVHAALHRAMQRTSLLILSAHPPFRGEPHSPVACNG